MENKGKIYCNACGKKIKAEKGILKEDVVRVEKEWGYFSKRDTEIHLFHLCEECYDKMVAKFKYPVTYLDNHEVL